jgi:hypothetical protein
VRGLPVECNLKRVARSREGDVHARLPLHLVSFLDIPERFWNGTFQRANYRREIISQWNVESRGRERWQSVGVGSDGGRRRRNIELVLATCGCDQRSENEEKRLLSAHDS